MTGRKKLIFVVLAIEIIILSCIAVFFVKIISAVDENTISRYEWIEMLCEQSGMTDYQNEKPYYADVNADNEYFPYIQSAAEWGVLDEDKEFKGGKYAMGRFVALTAMKTIGEEALKIYLGTDDEITDDIYMKLAVEHKLIGEKQLKQGLSEEECEQILEKIRELYFGEFWRDDYSSVVYQDNVIELSAEDVLQSNADCSEITVADDAVNSLETGDIIVFEQKNTKLKFAREITRISPDGILSLSIVELDRVVESLTVSDITELTFDNITNYYGLEENVNAAKNLNYRQTGVDVIKANVFSSGVSSRGYKFVISTEGEGEKKHLEVDFTNNDNGVSYKLPIEEEVEEDDDYNIEINVDKLYVGGKAEYTVFGGLKYAEAAVDAHAAFKSIVNAEKEKKFLLCKTPLPIGNGIIGVDISIYLVLSIEGSISFEAELPVDVSVSYEKGKGLRNFKHNIAIDEPKLEINCEAGVMLRLEPVFIILGNMNVLDAEADIGVSASAEVVTRTNSQICADISASFPVITIAVCKDDDIKTIIGGLGLSAEWEIISSDNAPKQIGFHYEVLPDRKHQFVKKCTYKKDSTADTGKVNTGETNTGETAGKGNTCYTKYKEKTGTDSPVFCFDYPDNWTVSKEEIRNGPTFGEYEEETIELTNERDVKITFIKFDSSLFEAGGLGHSYTKYKAEKVKGSMPLLSGDSGSFAVTRLTIIASMQLDTDTDYVPIDNGNVSYALMPESAIGSKGTLEANGFLGYYEMIAFDYPAPYVFFAESPDGKLTDEEETEITAILSSFREAP